MGLGGGIGGGSFEAIIFFFIDKPSSHLKLKGKASLYCKAHTLAKLSVLLGREPMWRLGVN